HDKCNDKYYHPSMFGEYMRTFADEAAVISLETHTPATEADAERVAGRFDDVEYVVFSNIFWRGSGSNRALIRRAVEAGKKVIVTTNDLYDSYFLPTVGTRSPGRTLPENSTFASVKTVMSFSSSSGERSSAHRYRPRATTPAKWV
ncbi:hypothetical protein LCGC14_2628680, partial [marine sediment metagenome]